MDPQAAWDDLLEALGERDWDRVEDLAEGLLRWLRADGFPPRAVTGSDPCLYPHSTLYRDGKFRAIALVTLA